MFDLFHEGGKGGYRSCFTENKAALSQFTKNTTLAFHGSRKIKENVLENHGSRRLWKSRFTGKKMAISHFTGNKKGRSRVTKYPPSS